MMWWLKACPKCGGDLVEEWDRSRNFIKCFQCGRELTTAEENRLRWHRQSSSSPSRREFAREEAAA